MKQRQQNSTTYPISFLLVSSTDHVSPVTGLGSGPVVTLSKNGAAFGASSGAVTEIGNGWYSLAGNSTDRNTLGELVLHATGTGADPADDRYVVVPWNPFDANLALGNLDATVSSRNATTPPTVTAIRTEMDSNSTKLANLDAAVSTRSTYAGGAVASVTSPVTVATNNDKTGYSLSVAPPTALEIAAAVWAATTRTLSGFGSVVADTATAVWGAVTRTLSDKSGYSLTSDYDAAKTTAAAPTTEQITDAILKRKIVWNQGIGKFEVYNEAGTLISFHLTPTTDAAALPITGMVSS